ncbi:cyclic nucleotide-binding protein [Segniliparus rotundus DSM 44985]|uniref:Cyclic nucleotide-binding protein n=1 Tax=Segniliparus rotundus (strain ATCC BAA-972 / CDC 1076 / CIP 108378 / DSM 44985 / JCM 13578) TaxID=640132 RepID=D6ZA60_SEGRD|nr:hypothetical protein [Segniliparus rotundus]ADG98730.1 cyclic nucleotide-binding protein [Segniliparus rotundus DSM 44985]
MGAARLVAALSVFAAALAAPAAVTAQADEPDTVVVRCEVWGPGGEDNTHLVGYAQGLGASRSEAQANAERDMASSYGLGVRLGRCLTPF